MLSTKWRDEKHFLRSEKTAIPLRGIIGSSGHDEEKKEKEKEKRREKEKEEKRKNNT